MAETYYQYAPDGTEVDLDDDQIYNYVLEREAYRKLASTGPKCMKNFKDMKEVDQMKPDAMNEHFTTGSKSWIKNIIIIALILIALYFIYTSFCNSNNNNSTSSYNYGPNTRYVFNSS